MNFRSYKKRFRILLKKLRDSRKSFYTAINTNPDLVARDFLGGIPIWRNNRLAFQFSRGNF